MKDLIKYEAEVRLWLLEEGNRVPVFINDKGFMQAVSGVPAAIFYLRAWSHPKIDGDIAYEIFSPSDKQITGAGGAALQEAESLMPMPVPAYRIIREDIELEEPRMYQVLIQTLDSRYVSAYERVETNHKVSKRDPKYRECERSSWDFWIGLHPDVWNVTCSDIVRSAQLNMLEPSEAKPDSFLLEWIDPPTVV